MASSSLTDAAATDPHPTPAPIAVPSPREPLRTTCSTAATRRAGGRRSRWTGLRRASRRRSWRPARPGTSSRTCRTSPTTSPISRPTQTHCKITQHTRLSSNTSLIRMTLSVRRLLSTRMAQEETTSVVLDLAKGYITPCLCLHSDFCLHQVYFEPDEVHACIVTCGGLCPGLNTVIREIVCGLSDMYGVTKILGIQGGYRGFYARNTIDLTPKSVNDIHKRGGTILGSSRGGHDTMKIVDSIQYRGINQVYVIGGDGSQRGAGVIFEEVRKRGLKVAVAGIPKTIDNDIPVIDKSFGFDSAVEEAQRAINAAHVEAGSADNGIGLVKLMGRYSGFIAHYATLASRDVDCCLIPESPFYLEGEGGLFKYIEKRLKENGHMVIVVAEGAGQKLIAENMKEMGQDASGNALLLDVGLWLSQKINEHFKKNKTTINLKYIDPTYMIRAIPSNASDNVYCTLLAHSVVHGAMAGYTGFTVGQVNGRHCYIPLGSQRSRTRSR
ncbi:hypothetical protein VPH35_127011 [Triticum aestivum]